MASVLYSAACATPADVAVLAEARTDLQSAQARGVCSRVYRLSAQESSRLSDRLITTLSGPSNPRICVKRVVEDDQWPPHAVAREVLAYKIIWDGALATDQDDRRFIVDLFAAFHDESDPFEVTYDLFMPWHPCTLQDLLDEPTVGLAKGDEAPVDGGEEEDRPTLAVLDSISAISPSTFALSTAQSLFAALRFLHAHGIAHRDIKPSNILVDAHDGATIKLIDFGTCWLSDVRYTPGDDGKGGVASEVGTGAYRCPESLLSPRNGYDAYKVDVWQAAATLVELMLPLRKVARPTPPSAVARNEPQDDRLAWERALWAKGADGEEEDETAWQELGDQIDSHAPNFFGPTSANVEEAEPEETSPTGYRRRTLFDGARGDLGLADSIFTLLGLPKADEEGQAHWPEAMHFQPSLDKLPFRRREPAVGGLRARLLQHVNPVFEADLAVEALVSTITACLQLSASKRISAEEAASMLT